jgi:hypothetical protein
MDDREGHRPERDVVLVSQMSLERPGRIEAARTRLAGVDDLLTAVRIAQRPHIPVAVVTVPVDRYLAMHAGLMSIFVPFLLFVSGQCGAGRAEDDPSESRQTECAPGVSSSKLSGHFDASFLDPWWFRRIRSRSIRSPH